MTLRCDARWLGLLVAGAVLARLALGAVAAIEGTTLGGDGLPLAGTSLTLAKTAAHEGESAVDFSATSDAFGRFAFAGLSAGRYAVSASHDGYQYYQGALLDLSAGQRVAGVTIQMSPLAVLSGRVTDEDGNPMPNVTVSPMHRDLVLNGRVLLSADGGTSVQSGVDGVYQLMLEPGHWYLSFTPPRNALHGSSPPTAEALDKPEQGYLETYYPGVTDSTLALGLVVVAGRQMPELNVRLRKNDRVPRAG